MEGRASIERISSFVALGDSFTEGLNDRLPDGGFRGWADRFADTLSAHQPGLRYANLAVRGKLLREVVTEQVPRAVEMAPDLVSIAAGGNDILRPRTDPDVLAVTFDECVARLRGAGCRVLLFTGFDPSAFPVLRILRGKTAVFNMHLRAIAAAHGCDVIDLWSMRVLCDRRMWSADRLHLNAEGHRRVALRVCEEVGVPVGEDWREPLPQPSSTAPVPAPVASAAAVAAAGASAGATAASIGATVAGLSPARLYARLESARSMSGRGRTWVTERRQDTHWAVEYAVPWVRRRLTGRSSGDEIPPKRPELLPLDSLARLSGAEAAKPA
jgi:lysophospholipase L1-like esterase